MLPFIEETELMQTLKALILIFILWSPIVTVSVSIYKQPRLSCVERTFDWLLVCLLTNSSTKFTHCQNIGNLFWDNWRQCAITLNVQNNKERRDPGGIIASGFGVSSSFNWTISSINQKPFWGTLQWWTQSFDNNFKKDENALPYTTTIYGTWNSIMPR